MSTYIVKTIDDRNLVIEADEIRSDSQEYRFLTKKGEEGNVVVAFVPRNTVFAIVEEKAEGADYYFSDREYDDRYNPPNIYESEEFLEAVADAVELLLTEDDELAADPGESVQ